MKAIVRLGSRLLGRSAPSSVRGATVGSVAASFWVQAMLLVSGVLAARMLGVEDRGHLALFALFPPVLAVLGSLGLPLAVTYEISRRAGSARAIARAVRMPAIVQGLLLAVLQAAVIVALVGGEGGEILIAGLLTIVAVPGTVALQYGLALLQGLQRFTEFNLLRLLPMSLYSVAAIILAVASAGDIVTVAAAWVGSYTSAGLLAIFVALRRRPDREEGAAPPSLSAMTRFGAKAVVGSVSPVEAFRPDQAVVGLFLSPAALGLYVVALAFANLPRFVAQSIGMVAYPHIAAQRARSQALRATWKFTALVAAICGAIVGALELTAGWLVPFFFGEAFRDAVPLARILMLGGFFFALRRVLGDCARGLNRPALASISEVVSWVALIPAFLILIPVGGVKGAALALTAASAFAFATTAVGLPISLRRGTVDDGPPVPAEPPEAREAQLSSLS